MTTVTALALHTNTELVDLPDWAKSEELGTGAEGFDRGIGLWMAINGLR